MEYVRLRQLYVAALRRWGQIPTWKDTELAGVAARQAVQLKQRALEERDAANERMRLHQRSCSECRSKMGNPRNPLGKGEVEVISKKTCHLCFRKENLAPCQGNSKGPCKNHRLLCSEHLNLKDGHAQCPECNETVILGLGPMF
jgi:hypothetical protein